MLNEAIQHGAIDIINSNIIEGWFFEEGVESSSVVLYINNIKALDIYATKIRSDICEIFKLDTNTKTGFIIEHNIEICKTDNIVLRFESTQKALEVSTELFLPSIKNCVKTEFLTHYSPSNVKFTVITDFNCLSNLDENNNDVVVLKKPLHLKIIKQLQYVAYSNKYTATASCNDALYIKRQSLECLSSKTSFYDFILHTTLNGWQHKTVYNTLANKIDFQTQTVKDTTKDCFNFWYEHCNKQIQKTLKNILFLISTQDGGTPLTNFDLMLELSQSFNCYVLRSDGKALYLSHLKGKVLVDIEHINLLEPINPISHSSHEYDKYFIHILYRYNISVVHIRHICWHSLTLQRATDFFNIPIVYSMHDYYAICPSHNLLDEKLQYCGGTCTIGSKFSKCNTVLWDKEAMPPLKHCFITFWKSKFEKFLQKCNSFVTTSRTTKNIYIKNYSFLQNKIKVIPHGRDLNFVDSRNSVCSEKLVVTVPGILSQHKGTEFISQIKQLDIYNNIKFVFLGPLVKELEGKGEFYGTYNRENLQTIIKDITPNVALIPSIWPETYCHVLTEMWSCNIPTIVLDYGAQAERTKKTNNGWVINHNAQEAYEFLQKLIKTPALLKEKELVFNTPSCKKMSQQYSKIYSHLTVN